MKEPSCQETQKISIHGTFVDLVNYQVRMVLEGFYTDDEEEEEEEVEEEEEEEEEEESKKEKEGEGGKEKNIDEKQWKKYRKKKIRRELR